MTTTAKPISAIQLAKTLGVPRNKIAEWREEGVIPSVAYGKVFRYQIDAVREALKAIGWQFTETAEEDQ